MRNASGRYIIIVGCSSFGAKIASTLSSQGNKVMVLDSDNDSFNKLSSGYNGLAMAADVTDIESLEAVGIDNADVVVAATNDDNTNIMVSQIADKIFNVPKVISRLYDIDKEQLIQGFNIQIINPLKLSIIEFDKILIQ